MKTLLMLVALALIFLIGRHFWRQRRPMRPPVTAQLTVRCAHCGIFLPREEAICTQEYSYCCPEHRDAGPDKR